MARGDRQADLCCMLA